MRINNVEYPNVSIRVIESKRVVGLTGPKSIHLYEANIKILLTCPIQKISEAVISTMMNL